MEQMKRQFLWVKIGVGVMAALWLGFVISGTVCRYLLNWSSTFDFGIFSQMYYYMKETGLPLTTCERDMLLFPFCGTYVAGLLSFAAGVLAVSQSHYSVCYAGGGDYFGSSSLLSHCPG